MTTHPEKSQRIRQFQAHKVVRALGFFFVFIFFLNAISILNFHVNGYDIKRINFNDERNIPTYFATLQLLFSAYLLWWIAAKKFVAQDHFRFHWRGLSLIFYFLALDEFFQIHDRIQPKTPGGWVNTYLILTAIVGLSYLYFLLKLPKKTRNLMALGGFVFVAGAIGMELVGVALKGIGHGRGTIFYQITTTIEESMEFIGILIFIKSLLLYITSQYGEFRKELKKSTLLITGP